MCLLVCLWNARADWPLIVAANRDEMDRPFAPVRVLQENPRILGGRDEVAKGTWLAVNEYGVVAALTNQPNGKRDPHKKSRGALPLLLTREATAEEAVRKFVATVDPTQYNPCWMLVADRHSLFYLDVTGSKVQCEKLPQGMHLLENKPLRAASTKIDRVSANLQKLSTCETRDIVPTIQHALSQHATDDVRNSACVHAGPYATRSSTIALFSQTAIEVWATDRSPCQEIYSDRSILWKK